jgi:glucose-1-phosphate thymidylyltransferase
LEAIADTPRAAGELALTESLVRRIDDGEAVRGVLEDGLWVDATFPWDLLQLSREMLREGRVDESERHPDTYVSSTARVHDRATLQAPVVVGPDCEVGAGAVIGPNTALGRNVTVGANATVVGSVLDGDTRVGPGSTLVETVTGQDVHVGAGSVVPGGPADVVLDERVFRAQDLGAVLADRVRTEGAVTTEPGALVGPGAYLGTGVVVRGRIDAGAEVVR